MPNGARWFQDGLSSTGPRSPVHSPRSECLPRAGSASFLTTCGMPWWMVSVPTVNGELPLLHHPPVAGLGQPASEALDSSRLGLALRDSRDRKHQLGIGRTVHVRSRRDRAGCTREIAGAADANPGGA